MPRIVRVSLSLHPPGEVRVVLQCDQEADNMLLSLALLFQIVVLLYFGSNSSLLLDLTERYINTLRTRKQLYNSTCFTIYASGTLHTQRKEWSNDVL